MTRTEDPRPEPRQPSDRFERFATTVGDLDSPFYDEERDRDVWNEASAVGFQLLLWGLPLVVAVCLWLGGATALPYGTAILVLWGSAAVVTVTYAKRRGVDPSNERALVASAIRHWSFAVVMAALAAALVRAAGQLPAESGAVSSFQKGAVQGASVAFVLVTIAVVVMATREALRRRRTAERT